MNNSPLPSDQASKTGHPLLAGIALGVLGLALVGDAVAVAGLINGRPQTHPEFNVNLSLLALTADAGGAQMAEGFIFLETHKTPVAQR